MSDSIPTLAPGFKVAVAGPNSLQISKDFNFPISELDQADALIFEVNTKVGISKTDELIWQTARDLYLPTLVLISGFEEGDIDFDDMSAIAGRVLDPLVTPYLVLHSDSGQPVALIELETLKLFDYSNGNREFKSSEPEHKDLVAEFQSEFQSKIEEFGPSAFADGLLFPAIPYLPKLAMGKIETLEYLAELPTRH